MKSQAIFNAMGAVQTQYNCVGVSADINEANINSEILRRNSWNY